MSQVVLFVCPHGAGKSRIAAADFNLMPPVGWIATSAGQEPQATVGVNAVRLLAGSEAEVFLDLDRPRSVESVRNTARTIAIDGAIATADERWQLRHQEFDEGMRDEIQNRVEVLVREIAGQ